MRKNLTIITVIFLIFSIFLPGKTGNMLIDFSREAYIPFQMLSGEKLVKDIFLIYGFFGYFFNFLIYKVSLNIQWILFLAHIISYFSVVIFYFIAQKFTNPKIALLLSIVFITGSIFSNSTFSYVLPYSYSTLWAYFGAYIAFFCYLNKNFRILYLLIGFIFINRPELFPSLFILFSAALIYEKKRCFFKKCFIFNHFSGF